jgi:hypothetical protein
VRCLLVETPVRNRSWRVISSSTKAEQSRKGNLTAQDGSSAVLSLARDDIRSMTGQTLIVDGGKTSRRGTRKMFDFDAG